MKLTSSNIDYSKTQSAGQDIRFTDSSGNDLAYEIEKWDGTGTSWVWVKVPSISINSSTDYMYMYYGNSSATDHQQATGVWNTNYVMVQHLPNGTTLSANDSTSNANNGTITGATATAGQIDGAGSFNGTSNYIDTGTNINPGSQASFSVWINTTSSVAGKRLLGKETLDYDTPFIIFNPTADKYDFFTSKSAGGNAYSEVTFATSGINNGSWHNLVATVNTTTITTYLDGVKKNTGSWSNGIKTSSENTLIGASKYGGPVGAYFAGTIDEVRISNTARSAAWIAASYKSEADTFNTFASEEQEYPSSGTLTSSIFDTEISAGAAWGTLTFSATTPTSTTATVKVRTSNSSSMTGATAFSSCDAITSGTDISSNNCVTDSHRYAQYLITLGTSAPASTPTFTSYSLAFSSYDADAPSISLTALTPDPNSDNTPTLSGTATDSIGTVSNVQLQMDSTSGSWSSCSASDGSFNSASEAFSCTAATLTDGSHTMYVRATDSNSNTTSSGYASDAFTIDATNPVSIDLDSPGDNSYTNSERPTFKWKATTDATAGLSKYVLEIDNPSLGSGNPSGDFTINDIPTSRTTDYETNKYLIHYENFSDSDSTNNYISVYTKSSTEWSTDSNSGQNDGKLRD